jgi:hypothetical protein
MNYKKILYGLTITALVVVSFPVTTQAATTKTTATKTTAKAPAKKPAPWKPETPKNYVPITWAKANGVASFTKGQPGNGYSDYLTLIYLPYNQIKLFSSSTPRLDWGDPVLPFTVTSTTSTLRNWAFAKMSVELAKNANPKALFIWDAPFHNITLNTSDLSLALKSKDTDGAFITSGSRPPEDVAKPRRMLIVDNKAMKAKIVDFDETTFINEGDQGVEGFDPYVVIGGATSTARLYLGVKPDGKELAIYCSRTASPYEAIDALTLAGVPVENQMQVDGGQSTTCAYNLPGQYFVEPGRMLPHLMGAFAR